MFPQVQTATVRVKSKAAPGAAWRCNDCQVWWGSQVSRRPKTSFLTHLPVHVAEGLPWDQYRGWKEAGSNASICPQCGRPSGQLVYVAE